MREETAEDIEEMGEEVGEGLELGESVATVEAGADWFGLSGAVPAGALVATPGPAYSLVQ